RRVTNREAGPLDEPAVGVGRSCRAVVAVDVGADAERDVAAHGAVFGLAAGVEGRDALDTPVVVVGRAVIHVVVVHFVREAAVITVANLEASPAAHFQAHIGAWDVIEPHTIQTA